MAISTSVAAMATLKLSNSMFASSPPMFSVISKSISLRTPAWKNSNHQGNLGLSVSSSGGFGSLRGGAGVLERPTFDQSQFDPIPQVEEGGDFGKSIVKRGIGSGDSYRVLLIDDERHTESLVEKALPKVVPSLTVIEARKLFHESRENGVAIVIVTVKEHAEFYVQMMLQCGLQSAMEPDSISA
ncbi:Ribosomal protein L7/L12 C-terminal/adaptor protein ClpS-like protein [Dioscorea alata]|uniref:Ribosomal protein L7/L12 C-terminal/adaptor protein ClpS-like protein n=1 Tax=Dioscorea alata TaxID=55571 RepID=A0ACB7UUF8_DIOAL|nr:Ribosomal protein L7/L12 C-terminal/adaptor protein ClpS-like protein [Dioscorea alata]